MRDAVPIARFLDGDGWVAWGAVPTDRPVGESADPHWRHLAEVWCELHASRLRPGAPAHARDDHACVRACGLRCRRRPSGCSGSHGSWRLGSTIRPSPPDSCWEPEVTPTQDFRYCGVCGAPLDAGATVCGNCGAAVEAAGTGAAGAAGAAGATGAVAATPVDEPTDAGATGDDTIAMPAAAAAGGAAGARGGRWSRRYGWAASGHASRRRRWDVSGDAMADRRARGARHRADRCDRGARAERRRRRRQAHSHHHARRPRRRARRPRARRPRTTTKPPVTTVAPTTVAPTTSIVPTTTTTPVDHNDDRARLRSSHTTSVDCGDGRNEQDAVGSPI